MAREYQKKQYGTTCYPEGRKIEVMSDYPEWTAWAVATLQLAAEKEAAAKFRAQEYNGTITNP